MIDVSLHGAARAEAEANDFSSFCTLKLQFFSPTSGDLEVLLFLGPKDDTVGFIDQLQDSITAAKMEMMNQGDPDADKPIFKE